MFPSIPATEVCDPAPECTAPSGAAPGAFLSVSNANRPIVAHAQSSRTRFGGGVRRAPAWSFVPLAVGVFGAVLLVDGSGSTELRHRAVAYVTGGVLLLPFLSMLVFGRAAGRLWGKLALSVAALGVTFGAVEWAARAFEIRALAPPDFDPHEVLGRVHVPNRGSIDAWGFRNAVVPEHADIVCIGDSQTYGENIPRGSAYPQQLAERSGRSVYNMSLGGYGPLQMVHLAERALTLSPRTIVLGFYPGNDLIDAHRFAALEHWSELQDPTVEYSIPSELLPVQRESANLALALLDGAGERSWLLRRCTYDLKLALKSAPIFARLYGRDDPKGGFAGGPIRTLFMADVRFGAVDLARPAVRDGLRITEFALRSVAADCLGSEVEVLLLLIPTKERVYQEFLVRRNVPEADKLDTVANAERDVTERVFGIARECGMRIVDPTEVLVEALATGDAPWPHGRDGHLNGIGSQIVAAALATALHTD